MPNIKSAQKRMELSQKARERNRARRSELRTTVKRVRQATTAEEAQERIRQATALLDRAAGKRLIHPNKAARIKSQLARHLNELSA
jgi:small subunit ribosomal protein S20